MRVIIIAGNVQPNIPFLIGHNNNRINVRRPWKTSLLCKLNVQFTPFNDCIHLSSLSHVSHVTAIHGLVWFQWVNTLLAVSLLANSHSCMSTVFRQRKLLPDVADMIIFHTLIIVSYPIQDYESRLCYFHRLYYRINKAVSIICLLSWSVK